MPRHLLVLGEHPPELSALQRLICLVPMQTAHCACRAATQAHIRVESVSTVPIFSAAQRREYSRHVLRRCAPAACAILDDQLAEVPHRPQHVLALFLKPSGKGFAGMDRRLCSCIPRRTPWSLRSQGDCGLAQVWQCGCPEATWRDVKEDLPKWHGALAERLLCDRCAAPFRCVCPHAFPRSTLQCKDVISVKT